MTTSNRDSAIRGAVEQMDALIDQRSALQRQISALKRSLKRDLGITPKGFEIALKLREMAQSKDRNALDGIREVAAVLGVEMITRAEVVAPPQASSDPEPERMVPVPQKQIVYQVLHRYGPIAIGTIHEKYLKNLDKKTVAARLYDLRKEGRAVHRDDGRWAVTS